MKSREFDIAIVGGLGHVGLPLGLVFAREGLNVCLYDLDRKNGEKVLNGELPFIEYEAEPILKDVLERRLLHVRYEAECLSKAKHVIIAIGTPVDEYLNPKTRVFLESIERLKPHLDPEQIIIVRSTVYPHTCQQMKTTLGQEDWKIAYCPERIVQGYSIRELKELPQIVSGLSKKAEDAAANLFEKISPKIIRVEIGEAELVKLFSNAWRYIQFAVANQFYMISHNFGQEYNKIRAAMVEGYGRAATLPSAGFAAGPCLLKDTMQLASFDSNQFLLGHAAMMVNEGLPNFMVEQLAKRQDLSQKKVGILGMAFKADIDDIRDSLSYKLGKILRFKGSDVYYSDEFAENPDFISKDEMLQKVDILIIGVPHSAYKGLKVPSNVEVVDLWGVIPR